MPTGDKNYSIIEELFKKEWTKFFNYACNHKADDPEDVVQEAFAKLLERWDKLEFTNPGQLDAYLFRIIRNEIISRRRRMKAKKKAIDGLARLMDTKDDPDDDAAKIKEEFLDLLAIFLQQLKGKSRSVIMDFFFHGVGMRDHARKNNTTHQSAINLKNKALQRLNTMLKREKK